MNSILNCELYREEDILKSVDLSLESSEVKRLREKYGIGDSRNTYTCEELIEVSQRKIYYISPYGDETTGNIYIKPKIVLGYISKDESPYIWIKDKDIKGDKCYYPIQLIRKCKEVKKGIYHNELDDILYCTTNELEFCINYEKVFVEKNIQEQIKELQNQILKLKNIKIIS